MNKVKAFFEDISDLILDDSKIENLTMSTTLSEIAEARGEAVETTMSCVKDLFEVYPWLYEKDLGPETTLEEIFDMSIRYDDLDPEDLGECDLIDPDV
jgi:hypothetical protein